MWNHVNCDLYYTIFIILGTIYVNNSDYLKINVFYFTLRLKKSVAENGMHHGRKPKF